MKILGIDPGLDVTGYGLIENKDKKVSVLEAGIIKTLSKDALADRIKTIYSQLSDIIISNSPDVCVIEKLYSHYKHPMTAILMGHARGVVLFCCSQNGVRIVEYPAKTSKKAITGNGNATKQQVQRVVGKILNLRLTEEPFDLTDALALCLTYIYHSKNSAPEAVGV